MVEVRTVLAPNPGLFTGPGTNTYIVASGGEAIVIDPGPDMPEHHAAIEGGLDQLAPVMVAVTHTHPDHAPAANPLARSLGVPAYGYGEGPGFKPDVRFADTATVRFGASEAVAVATPGHTDDHLCFRVGDALFTGDHIMGGSTVIIEDLAAYLESLRLVRSLDPARIYPGHGPEIDDPAAIIDYYLEHRLEREQQILAALRAGAGTVGEIVTQVYTDTDPSLQFAAAYSVAAHLRKLAAESRVEFTGKAEWGAQVELVEETT